ncbi:hypothetical protein QJU23_03520 [Pasteurella atlantica]|uniref:Uncharacterized protein n=2 Tax=Pasteurellaceae TaxID=712 RepID=A0ACC6HKU7_9PAST|nr:hypothetical protein [Pasteurella atlantica]MDP8051495.1 hypothetical protein [Pasteurella atlantica]MDP8106006.1 hypothetical protein [Pasteurella atlantica]MDP8148153.1 hypothetical protein [Pasteurella atlantica]
MKKINNLYKQQNYFDVVNIFENTHKICVPDKNVFFYKNKDDVENKLNNETEFFYNPAISHLYKYHQLPQTTIETLKKEYKNELINSQKDPIFYLVATNNFNEAFLKGSGIIAVKKGNDYEYHSIRLFSLIDNIIGQISPIRFNLFFQKCDYCQGFETITSYSKEILGLEINKSPLDPQYSFNKLLVVPKLLMKAFTKNGIIDFNKKIEQFSPLELNHYFYGLKNLGVARAKSKPDEISYWEGLNSYLYDQRNKIKSKKGIDLGYFYEEKCPFCYYGYKNEIKYYQVDNKNIVEYLKEHK